MIYQPEIKLAGPLGNPKDQTEYLEKSGIYEVTCNDFNLNYIGQTKRYISKRFKEHSAHLKYGTYERSSLAYPISDCSQKSDIGNLRLLMHLTKPTELDAYEDIRNHKKIVSIKTEAQFH